MPLAFFAALVAICRNLMASRREAATDEDDQMARST
jgi:hypothetical protein